MSSLLKYLLVFFLGFGGYYLAKEAYSIEWHRCWIEAGNKGFKRFSERVEYINEHHRFGFFSFTDHYTDWNLLCRKDKEHPVCKYYIGERKYDEAP